MRTQIIRITKENADHYFQPWLKLYRHEKVNPFFFKPQDYPDTSMRRLYDHYVSSSSISFLVYESEDGQIIGTARVTVFKKSRSHVAMLNAVAIHPDFQGQQYGTKFLETIINGIKKNPGNPRITQIELAYEGDNPAARHFYERKLQFVRKLNYEDWWTRRFEANFQKNYFWYADERCCVRYLNSPPKIFDNSHLVLETLAEPPSLSKKLRVINYGSSPLTVIPRNLQVHYCGLEVALLERIIKRNGQEIYNLMDANNFEVKAMLLIRPYGGEPRLKHAVTVPAIAFVGGLETETLAAFIHESLKHYRTQNPGVFHFSSSEEDTEENWYTDQHPKITILAKAMQLAGFRFLGSYENYFNEEFFSGRHLLGFSAIYLGLREARECLELSKLSSRVKEQLGSILSEIEGAQKYSSRAEYEIYRIIRLFAYPQDYTFDEQRLLIEKSCALLQIDPQNFIRVLEEHAPKSQTDLFAFKEKNFSEDEEPNLSNSFEKKFA